MCKKRAHLLARVIQLEKPSSWQFSILLNVCKQGSAVQWQYSHVCSVRGKGFVKQQHYTNNLCITSTTGSTWHVPRENINVHKIPVNKCSIQSCL